MATSMEIDKYLFKFTILWINLSIHHILPFWRKDWRLHTREINAKEGVEFPLPLSYYVVSNRADHPMVLDDKPTKLHALPGGTPAPCRPLCFLLLVQFPNPFVNLFPAQSPLFIVCRRYPSRGGFFVSIAYQKQREKGGFDRPYFSIRLMIPNSISMSLSFNCFMPSTAF